MTKPKSKRESNKPTQKVLPDISKLSKVSPTKIPKGKKPKEQTRERINWKLLSFSALGIILLIVLAYGNSVLNDFVFNDHSNVKSIDNPDLFWLSLWSQAAMQPLAVPWLVSTYAWDTQWFGMSPVWFHIVNVCLHITACLYLFLLVFRLAWLLKSDGRLRVNPYYVAIAATALFACHPLTSGAVAYISGRAGPLLACNYFLSLNCFLFAFFSSSLMGALFWYLLAIITVLIGLWCSPQAVTLPCAMLALAFLLKAARQPWKRWFAERWPELSMLTTLALTVPFVILLGVPFQSGNGTGIPTLASIPYYASQLKLLVTYYLRSAVVPVGLSIQPPLTVATNFVDPLTILGAVFIIASLCAIWMLRQFPLVVFGILLFLFGLLPNSVLTQPEVVADYRFYLSLAGLSIIAGWVLARLAMQSFRRAAITAAVIVVLFAGLTIWQNTAWKTDESLWKAEININPNSSRAHAMLASVYVSKERFLEAERQAKKALSLDSRNPLAFYALGKSALKEKQHEKALATLSKVLPLEKGQNLPPEVVAQSQAALAQTLNYLGRPAEAKPHAQEALKVDPSNPALHLILAKAWLAEKQPLLALRELQDGYRFDPLNPDFLQTIVEAGLATGQARFQEMAYRMSSRLVQVSPTQQNQIWFARAAIETGNTTQALEKLNTSFKTDPRNAEVNYLLSVAHKQLGHVADAAKYLTTARKLDLRIEHKVHLFLRAKPKSSLSSG